MTVTIRQKKQKYKTSYLYADIMFHGKRIKYSIGITIESGSFDAKRQIVKGRESMETNNLLSHFKTIIYKVMREMQLDGESTTKELRSRLDAVIRQVKQDKREVGFLDFVYKHFERVKLVLKRRTVLNYQSTINKLIAYQSKHSLILGFEDINYGFYHSFLDYCRTDLELATNTIGTHVKNIKAWMTVATEEGVNTNLSFKSKGFKVIEEKVETIYLSIEELDRIRELNLEGTSLERVRDIFLVGCFTGVRIGDYHKINFDNLMQDKRLIKIIAEKTGEEVIIPLHPFVSQVLDKYGGCIPMLSHQKFNKHIKSVAALAGIDNKITIRQTKGNKLVRTTQPKYKLVSSHCARRSFATNAFKAGLPSLSIMQITGHRTEKNFLKYIRVSREENAALIAKNAFFSHVSPKRVDAVLGQ